MAMRLDFLTAQIVVISTSEYMYLNFRIPLLELTERDRLTSHLSLDTLITLKDECCRWRDIRRQLALSCAERRHRSPQDGTREAS